MKNILKLVISIIICESAGVLGSFFTTPAIKTWYAFLDKPSFSPPNWLFGPAWVLLYALMGIAIALVWPKLWKLFSIHLIINALWSVSFFGLKNPLLGLINIIILWVLILVLLLKFYRLNKTSFWLFVPYFLWVSFATALNFSVWQLNLLQPDNVGLQKEQACVLSSGTVGTSLCCKSSGDFPNTALIGACGCSPDNSHEVKVCDCGPDKVFDGTGCVNQATLCRPEQRQGDVCFQIYDPVCAKVNIQCIKAPCDPVNQTFSNPCLACRNSLVESYVRGECAD